MKNRYLKDSNPLLPSSLARRVLNAVIGAAAFLPDVQLRIHGESMLPALADGTRIVVRQTMRGIGPGALIVFNWRGDLIVHRVVRIFQGSRGRVFVTKGDNNPNPDPPVSEQDVVGKVVAVEP